MSFDDSIAYSTSENGVSTNMLDLVVKLKDFLVNDAGFTLVDERSGEVTVDDKYIILSKDSLIYHFFTRYETDTDVEGQIYLHINKNYDNTKTFWEQTNNHSASSSLNKSVVVYNGGIPQYYFYWNSRNLYIICEYKIGYYCHASMGFSTSYQNKEIFYKTSNLNGRVLNNNDVDNDFSQMFGENTSLNYESFQDDVADDRNDIIIDGYSSSSSINNFNFPVFRNSLKVASFISVDNKSLIWSPNVYLEVDNSYFYPIIKHSDNFLAYNEYFNNLEEFNIGVKTFKFFPFHQKTTPSNFSNPGRSTGICMRIS